MQCYHSHYIIKFPLSYKEIPYHSPTFTFVYLMQCIYIARYQDLVAFVKKKCDKFQKINIIATNHHDLYFAIDSPLFLRFLRRCYALWYITHGRALQRWKQFR